MRWLLFISKLAFISNVFFVFTVILHFYSFLQEQALVSTIVIIGYALSVFLFTPLVNILYLVFLVLRRKLFALVPKWLVITNFIFLLLQLAYIILFLNGSVYN